MVAGLAGHVWACAEIAALLAATDGRTSALRQAGGYRPTLSIQPSRIASIASEVRL